MSLKNFFRILLIFLLIIIINTASTKTGVVHNYDQIGQEVDVLKMKMSCYTIYDEDSVLCQKINTKLIEIQYLSKQLPKIISKK